MKRMLKKSSILLLALMVMFCMASPVSAASISKKKVTLCVGQTVQLKIRKAKKKAKWTSSNKKIATVSSKGKVKAKKKGKVTITARIGKKKYKCKVTIESPKMNKSSISLNKGKNYQLKMQNTKQKYKWSSKDKSIASVSSNGKVTGKKTGTTYIYAKSSSGKKFKCKITVKNNSNNFSSGTNSNSTNKYPTPSKSSVTYHAEATPRGEVVILQNHNNYAVSADLSCAFYLNNRMVTVRKQYNTIVIEPHMKYATLMDCNDIQWDSVKINLNLTNVSFFDFNAKNVSYTPSLGSNSVFLTVTNKGKTNPGAHMAVVYYKNNKIIGCDDALFANIQNKGDTDYLESSFPMDDDWNYIVPDRYEVYVNMCYTAKDMPYPG